MANAVESLHELARLYGIQTTYHAIDGRQQDARPEALVGVLRILGAGLERVDEAPDALRHRQQELWQRWLEPVTVAWDGRSEGVAVRLPASLPAGPLRCRLQLESGETRAWVCDPGDLPLLSGTEVEGVSYTARRLALEEPLPLGYHRLYLEQAGRTAEALLLAAPLRAHEPADGPSAAWGVFLPLYALHSERSWGAGDLGDLEELTAWVAGLGGGLVATLPLLAAFLDEPFEPGPYAPASRLFWNEFYLHIPSIPELQACPAAQARLASAEFQQAVQELRSTPLVDYRRQMALKRSVLEELAYTFFTRPSPRLEAFRRFVAEHPHAEDYARFRAVGERRRVPWPAWPAPLRDGNVGEGDYEPAARDYHLYVQWLADEQLQALAARARARGPGLYLDLPLGVHPDSYDVWREREAFAIGASAGAPPDPFFARGQDWGFPPLHPERIRTQGYRYLAAYLRHHLRRAGVLRLDHVMGLHRLYWIPHGLGARDGVYVQYPADELYAVLTLESNRHGAVLVGEDLGTVSPEVRPALARHGIHRMYVQQFELQAQPERAINAVPAGAVASFNTHDLPPFAAFWQGLDIHDRMELGILDEDLAETERRRRGTLLDAVVRYLRTVGRLRETPEPLAVLKACLAHLSAGPARLVLVNLEDLWLETEAQNMPGTWRERPNWRRRARYSLKTIGRMPEVLEILWEIDHTLKGRDR